MAPVMRSFKQRRWSWKARGPHTLCTTVFAMVQFDISHVLSHLHFDRYVDFATKTTSIVVVSLRCAKRTKSCGVEVIIILVTLFCGCALCDNPSQFVLRCGVYARARTWSIPTTIERYITSKPTSNYCEHSNATRFLLMCDVEPERAGERVTNEIATDLGRSSSHPYFANNPEARESLRRVLTS
jgi:hypothetical protein